MVQQIVKYKMKKIDKERTRDAILKTAWHVRYQSKWVQPTEKKNERLEKFQKKTAKV